MGGSGGNKIAFVYSNREPPNSEAFVSEIFVMNTDGSGQTNLTNHSAWDCCPAWSPDGTKIVFTSDRDGNGEIYVMNADGSNPTRLTFNDYWDRHPAWSPDSTKIVFVSYQPNDLSGIQVMNADGSNQITLAHSGEGYYISPSWSPDGAKIAFVREGFGGFACQGCSEIFVMNADGGSPIQITYHNSYSQNPAWSPDGTKIAYETYVGLRDIGIVVVNPDGSGQTHLANTDGWDSDPSWSPDGKMIVFLSDRGHINIGEFDIYIINAFGSDPSRLTSGGNSSSPVWLHITQTAVTQHSDCTSGWSRLTAGNQAKVSEEVITPNRVRARLSTADAIIILLYLDNIVNLLEARFVLMGWFSGK